MIFGFSKKEISLICEILNEVSVTQDYISRGALLLEVQNAVRDSQVDRKWGVNRTTLNAKIEALDSDQVQTLIDSVVKFWGHHATLEAEQAFAVAGLDAKTAYLINSAVISTGQFGLYRYKEQSEVDLGLYIRREHPVSRVGYQDTCDVIEQIAGYLPRLSRAPSAMDRGEHGMVVRLKYRLQEPGLKGRPTQALSPSDFEIGLLERIE